MFCEKNQQPRKIREFLASKGRFAWILFFFGMMKIIPVGSAASTLDHNISDEKEMRELINFYVALFSLLLVRLFSYYFDK